MPTLMEEAQARREREFYRALLARLEQGGGDPNNPLLKAVRKKLRSLERPRKRGRKPIA